ncbi:hypothetical protein C8R47DRAFT_1209970 [Mycena vitilis]|nr:hypothetical protein C8R47DRAFT_1209970 [Mycena vitilis]
MSFSPRWKHISLTGPVSETGIDLSRTDVPLPESIAISRYASGNGPTGPQTHDVLCGVGVRIVSPGTNTNPMQLPLPWSPLTTFNLDRYYDTYGMTPHREPDVVPYPNAIKIKRVEADVMLFTAATFPAFVQRLPPTGQHLLLCQNLIGPGAPTFVDDAFLRSLAPSSESATAPVVVLPQMDTIELIYAAHFLDQELLRFIPARMNIHPLRRVRIRFDRYAEEDILPQLQPLIDEFGLDFSLKYELKTPKWNPRAGLPGHLPYDM